jgi:TM2 domain-containing membrane protein YozV
MMQLSTQQQILVEQRLANEKKSAAVAYLLWFFLPAFAVHRFYLGSPGIAAAQIALFWGGLLLSAVLIGIPLLIVFGIWWIVDAFLINGLVAKDAAEKRARLMNEVALTTRAEG